MKQIILITAISLTAISASSQVYNPRITVVTPPPSNSNDIQLSSKVNELIRSRVFGYASENYNIFTQAGQVTIQGRARNQAEADEILAAARTAPGVSSIVNAITINPNF